MNSFRKEFKPFYQEKFDRNFIKDKDTIIAIDTNYLLSILRLDPKVANKYIDALEHGKGSIYISYFVGLEFLFNKVNVRIEKSDNIGNINKDIKKMENQMIETAKKIAKLINSDKEKSLINSVNKCIKTFQELIQDKESLKKQQEEIYNRLIDVIDPLLGDKPSQNFIDEVEKDGEKRYKNETPPGYDDQKKTKKRELNGLYYDNKFGDLLIWKDLLNYISKQDYKKFIFVTDDGKSNKKNDLYYKYNENIVGPRIELIDEMNRETGADMYILDSKTFVSYNVELDEDDQKQIDNLNLNEDDQKQIDNLNLQDYFNDPLKRMLTEWYTRNSKDYTKNEKDNTNTFKDWYYDLLDDMENKKDNKVKMKYIYELLKDEKNHKNDKD